MILLTHVNIRPLGRCNIHTITDLFLFNVKRSAGNDMTRTSLLTIYHVGKKGHTGRTSIYHVG